MFGKASALLKTTKLLSGTNKFTNSVRNGHHWNYRVNGPTAPRIVVLTAEFVCSVAWWWVLWHLFTEPGHVFGEFKYPDVSKWTNKELGIPED